MDLSNSQKQRNSTQFERTIKEERPVSIGDLSLNLTNSEGLERSVARVKVPSSDFVERCRQRFLDLFSPYSDTRMYGSFSRIFTGGINRPIDDLITRELQGALTSREERRSTMKLLEVGAGTPYGTNSNFGSPWLARCFRSTLSSGSEVVVSDKKGAPSLDQDRIERHFLFYLDTRGALHSFPFNAVLKAGERAIISSFVSLAEGTHTLLPISIDDLKNVADHHLTEPSSTVDFMVRNYGAGGLFFVRPELDGEMESFLFGTHLVLNVDYYNLIASFPAQSFDFIFARHLVPLPPGTYSAFEKIELLSESIAKVLRPSGAACLHFDFPAEGEGDLVRVSSLSASSRSSEQEYSLHWTRNGKSMCLQRKSYRL